MANKYCPICGEANGCMAGAEDCWCNHETFPNGVFELIPEESRNKQCICKNCLDKYKEENNQ